MAARFMAPAPEVGDHRPAAPGSAPPEPAAAQSLPPEVWVRHKPQQPSPHRSAEGFGSWIDPSRPRVTDDPSALASLVSAPALTPALLEPAPDARLNELAGYFERREHPDAPPTLHRVEPFANVPRAPAKPLSSRERKRLRSSEERYTESALRTDAAMKRWAAWWRELGEPASSIPPLADPETHAICRAIVCSREAADAGLRLIGNSYGGSVLYRCERSAFGDPSAPKWDTRSLCGRRQVALCMFMLRQSRLKFTGTRDRFGRAIMQPCVWGVGRGYLQALLADPETRKPLSRERLTHSTDSCDGMFYKGEAARVFARQSRIPAEVADRDEIGPSGHTFNRYWVCRHWNPKAALRENPDGLSDEETNARAWEWFDTGIRAQLRGRFLHPSASVDVKWVEREAPS